MTFTKKMFPCFLLRRALALLTALGFAAGAGAQTSIVVTNTGDAGPGTLRQALADAEAIPGSNTITFGPALNGRTITLTSYSNPGGIGPTAIVLFDNGGVIVDATSLPDGLTISGAGQNLRLFLNAFTSTATLRGLTLAHGGGVDTTFGGAIANYGILRLTRCNFTGNAAGGIGGAIYTQEWLMLTQCSFSSNSTGGSIYSQGGAIYGLGTLIATGCTFSSNFSSQGGAIYGSYSMLTNCTFTGNTASADGGALSLCCSMAILQHCTVAGNLAGGPSGTNGGGGLYSYNAHVTLQNSIVAGNSANGIGADIYSKRANSAASISLTRVGANLIQSLVNIGDATDTGPAAITNAPLLAPLGHYGGPTMTMALLPGSPARNAAVGSTATNDQRGFPIVGTPDIGAYEAGTSSSNFNAFIWESLATTNIAAHAADFDYDGDCASNYNEWVARTDPGSAASVLRITKWERVSVPVVGAADSITFTTESGLIYAVFHTDELAVPMVDSSEFHTIGNGFPQTVLVPIPPGVRQRFFQVRIVP